ncbi:485_t:CDS:2, partial [Racocetra persica]
ETSTIINKIQIFDDKFESAAKIRAFLDTFIKNIPQLVIQVLYFNSIVTYSIIPFLTLCTTIFMIILTNTRSLFELFKKKENKGDDKTSDKGNDNKKSDEGYDDKKGNKKNKINDDDEKEDNEWIARMVEGWVNEGKGNTEIDNQSKS